MSEPKRKWKGLPEFEKAGMLMTVEELTEDPANARLHPDDNMEIIKRSFDGFSQCKNIVVHRFQGKKSYTVIAGNGGLRSAIALGWTHIAAAKFQGSDDEARAYAIADNRASDTSRWDREVLVSQLTRLSTAIPEMGITGFDTDDLANLKEALWAGDEVDIDNIPGHDREKETVVIKIMDVPRGESAAIVEKINAALDGTGHTAEAY